MSNTTTAVLGFLFIVMLIFAGLAFTSIQNGGKITPVPCTYEIQTQTISSVQYYYSYNCQTNSLLYGGPSNAGGVTGTSADSVLQTTINQCPTGIFVTNAVGCRIYITDGDYYLMTRITIHAQNTWLIGNSQFGTELDWNNAANSLKYYLYSNGQSGSHIQSLSMKGDPSATDTNGIGIYLTNSTQFFSIEDVYQTQMATIGLLMQTATSATGIAYGYVSNFQSVGQSSATDYACIMFASTGTGFINGVDFYTVHCSGWFEGIAMATIGAFTVNSNIANDRLFSVSVESSTRGLGINDASASDNYLEMHYDVGTVTTPEQIIKSGINTISETPGFYTIGLSASLDETGSIHRIGYTSVGKITNPFENSFSDVGLAGASGTPAAGPTTLVTYTVNFPIAISCSGGTVTAITIKDPAGNTYASGTTCVSLLAAPVVVPVGYSIEFTFAVAPTVSVFGVGD